MKIVCDSCQAKYSIADEKVAGKVFKIKCKRCGSVLTVRGDEQAPAGPPALAGRNYPEEAIWHVVINGEQHGPYDASQIAEMLSNGTVDWEAYVWCEGFDNWSPMRDVQELVAQITAAGSGGEAVETIDEVRASAASYTPPSMGADPFADDAGSAPSPFEIGGGGGRDAGPDLFGSSSSSPYEAPSAPHAAPTQAQMTGQRHENSVLFSLKNLQALATGGSSPGGSPMGVSPGMQSAPGMASGEGSGLIDIRALATATGVGDNGKGARDDLLQMGAQGGAFGALGSPVLAPVAEDGDSQRRMLIIAGVAAVAFLSLAGVAIAWLLRPQAAPAPQQIGTAPIVAPAAPAAPAAAPAAAVPAAPAQPPSEGELAALRAAEAAKAAEAPAAKPAAKSSDSTPAKRSSAASKSAPSAAEPDLSEPAPKKPSASSGGSRSLDDLLEGALTKGTPQKASAASGADSSLPDQPSRNDVMAAMGGVKDGVTACAQGQSGVAIVNVTVAGSTGRVTSAQVEGITGPAGSCIAREARKASFPRFKQATFKVKYPYRL